MLKTLNLAELDNQPIDIQEAVAFYAAHTVLPIQFSKEDRDRHYRVLEQAGYIERVNVR